MSKERAAKVMQEIFSKGTYEGDLLGINEGRKMKDTVTYPLSAIIDECNHDLSEQETACADGFCPICATAELAEAKEQLRLCNVDQFTTAAELAEANARLDWLDTVECGIQHRSYGEYWHYIGKGFPKAREVIDEAMKEGK